MSLTTGSEIKIFDSTVHITPTTFLVFLSLQDQKQNAPQNTACAAPFSSDFSFIVHYTFGSWRIGGSWANQKNHFTTLLKTHTFDDYIFWDGARGEYTDWRGEIEI